MNTSEIKRFEVGRIYSCRSVCDHDCIWTYKVISRTECTVKLKEKNGEVKTCRINKKVAMRFGYEMVMPDGNYSMAPCICAD